MRRSYGHIKISRKMFDGDDPFWSEERRFSRAEAWIDLIQEASWRDREAVVDGQVVQLGRGQLIGSQRYLADRWGWSTKKVRRFLGQLEDLERIDTEKNHQKNHLGALITIVNYDRYQYTGSKKNRERTRKRTTQEPPMNHQKEPEKDTPDDGSGHGDARADSDPQRTTKRTTQEPPKGTKENTKKTIQDNNTENGDSIPVEEMWGAFVEVALDGETRRRLTEKRKGKLRQAYREHLRGRDDPIQFWRKMCRAVVSDDWWGDESRIGVRLPEKAFKNEEKREEWAMKAERGGGRRKGGAFQGGMFTTPDQLAESA